MSSSIIPPRCAIPFLTCSPVPLASKYATSFLNSSGGSLFFGVHDAGFVMGIPLTQQERQDLTARVTSWFKYGCVGFVSAHQRQAHLVTHSTPPPRSQGVPPSHYTVSCIPVVPLPGVQANAKVIVHPLDVGAVFAVTVTVDLLRRPLHCYENDDEVMAVWATLFHTVCLLPQLWSALLFVVAAWHLVCALPGGCAAAVDTRGHDGVVHRAVSTGQFSRYEKSQTRTHLPLSQCFVFCLAALHPVKLESLQPVPHPAAWGSGNGPRHVPVGRTPDVGVASYLGGLQAQPRRHTHNHAAFAAPTFASSSTTATSPSSAAPVSRTVTPTTTSNTTPASVSQSPSPSPSLSLSPSSRASTPWSALSSPALSGPTHGAASSPLAAAAAAEVAGARDDAAGVHGWHEVAPGRWTWLGSSPTTSDEEEDGSREALPVEEPTASQRALTEALAQVQQQVHMHAARVVGSSSVSTKP